jgi:hypothetical protein
MNTHKDLYEFTIGEAYAEEVLGMEKAEAGRKGIDGIINGRKVQVKSKAPRKVYDISFYNEGGHPGSGRTLG